MFKGLSLLQPRDSYAPPARLPRDVPEKAETFLRDALLSASCKLPPFVAMMRWLAAPDQLKASFFQTPHEAEQYAWSADPKNRLSAHYVGIN
jgi:hypothetical protein